MILEQASHFREESEILFDLVSVLSDKDLEQPTQFKRWNINDILVHLHFWNLGADLALNDPDAFQAMFKKLYGAMEEGNLRSHENSEVEIRGQELVSVWADQFRDMGERWQNVDPKTRVKWAGPDMSARTSISARQMETWAHGQAVFDLLGSDRPESDRIKNIVMLGINAFGWSHKVHGLEIPETMPSVSLVSPTGENWSFGEGTSQVTGSAVEFCQVVTQTRNIADTSIKTEGESAKVWMAHAQCFAGPPETPPAPGTRFKQ